MKVKHLTWSLVFALGAAISACSENTSDRKTTSIEGHQNAQEKSSYQEFTGEPASPEEMAGQSYRLKTEKQDFLLHGLAHLVWTGFLCDAEVTDESSSQVGQLKIEFYPEMKVSWIESGSTEPRHQVASSTILCGDSLENQENPILSIGSLAKTENDQYVLEYVNQNSSLQMNWDASQSLPGEATCTSSTGQITQAILTNCHIL